MHCILKRGFPFRLVVCIVASAITFSGWIGELVAIEKRSGGSVSFGKKTSINEIEASARMAAFRNQRLVGDYCFRFQLIQKPRRGRNVYYQGTMWGSWNEWGPVSRVLLYPEASPPNREAPASASPIEMIVQNGIKPLIWLRRNQDEKFQLVEGEDVFNPVIDGVLFRFFDLQMPFVYWSDCRYEGPARLGHTGHVQLFKAYPSPGSAAFLKEIESVRIALDDVYNTLRRVEIIGADGKISSVLETRSFCKVQEQWIAKEISLKDYATKVRTSFLVVAAATGIQLDASIFNPASLNEVPLSEKIKFKVL